VALKKAPMQKPFAEMKNGSDAAMPPGYARFQRAALVGKRIG